MIITQFGNDILRQKCRHIAASEIGSIDTKKLIDDMKSTLLGKKLGIGLAAPQVGVDQSLAVIELQKTEVRPDTEELSLVIINPKITQTFGQRTQLWEGCISSGNGKAGLFAKVPRYKKIELEYLDVKAVKHTRVFEGLAAHVIQHEVDHLNGILFVDRVKDPKTYKTYKEYKKMLRML
jgi:peptide deformylase